MIEWKGFVATYKGRKLGFINEANVFVAPRKEETHFFYKFDGYGMNEELVYSLLEKGIQMTLIMIERRKGKKLLKVATPTWLEQGKKYVNIVDGEKEPQLILAEGKFADVMEDIEWQKR